MNDALISLELGLTRTFAEAVRAPEGWRDLLPISRALARVQRDHGGAGIAGDRHSIMSAIDAFQRTSEIEGLRNLKYVCLGVGVPGSRGWCVLADAWSRDYLFKLVESQGEMRRRIRCFQALLSSYWTFPIYNGDALSPAVQGWGELRLWLRAERQRILLSNEPKPPWFGDLTRHVQLLSDEPCERFGAALLNGDSSGLNDAMKALAIPQESWVLEEAVYARIRAAVKVNDDKFKLLIPSLLELAMGKGGVKIGERLRIRCVAQLVSRYGGCNDRPENMALRDASTSTIGNPWLNRAKWDARVTDANGKPDDRAREMVNGWLKRRLIEDFFLLLSYDGTGDPRRLDYWLRYEPFIEDMWFALGTDARSRRGAAFDEFRSRARGRLLDLTKTTSDNNAFVMRIGNYLAVEFGAKGNAFYLLEWGSLDESLLDILESGRARAFVEIGELKVKDPGVAVATMNHSSSAGQSWEQRFDYQLFPFLGRKPANAPHGALARAFTVAEWNRFVVANELNVDDRRAKGGALWVVGQELPQHVVAQLNALGFKRKTNHGWHKE